MDRNGHLNSVGLLVVHALDVDAVAPAVDCHDLPVGSRLLGGDTPHDPDLVVLADGEGTNLRGTVRRRGGREMEGIGEEEKELTPCLVRSSLDKLADITFLLMLEGAEK
eukprot:746736-Hanusia_phi.AAC.2